MTDTIERAETALSIEDKARILYKTWRGGKAEWSRLTPENKSRWIRAASPPGIAIVALPGRDEISAWGIKYGPGASCDLDCCPGWIEDDNSGVDFSISEAREYAAALLAAANKAEQESS